MLTTNSIRSNNKQGRKRTLLRKSLANSIRRSSQQQEDAVLLGSSETSTASTLCSSLNDSSSSSPLLLSQSSSTTTSRQSLVELDHEQLLPASCNPQFARRRLQLLHDVDEEQPSMEIQSFDRKQRHLVETAAALSVAGFVLFGATLVQFLPLALIVAGSAMSASMGMLLYTVMCRVFLEYQTILSGKGFGVFLPESVYNQLTNATLHETLFPPNDPEGGPFKEWMMILALYFMPGISKEQREIYISHLAPRQLHMLSRKGLGNLFGDQFMRILVGEQRYWRGVMNMDDSPEMPTTSERSVVVQRSKEENIGLDLEEETEEDQQVLQITSQEKDMTPEERKRRELEDQEDIMKDAMKEAAKTCTNVQVKAMSRLLGPKIFEWFLEPTTKVVGKAGAATSILSMTFGFFQQFWLSSSPRSSRSPMEPSALSWWNSHTWIYMATFGGASAGLSLVMRHYVRSMIFPNRNEKKYRKRKSVTKGMLQ